MALIPEHTAHLLHYVAWILAVLDVVIVALCLFATEVGH